MNGQVEVIWRTLRTIAHSLLVHDRVLEAYIYFELMYKIDNISLVLPIKDLTNEDGYLTTQFKLATCKEPLVSHSRVLFCPCVVWKATSHVGTKALNMRQQAQKCFRGIFVGIPQYQKGNLVYVLSTRNIISSYYVVFDEMFSSALAYMSQPYS